MNPEATATARTRFRIRDLLAMVIGYGMASIFVRAFWPEDPPPTRLFVPAIVAYLWLGLAMSGPILLGRTTDVTHPRTWAEWAWLFVGVYWIVLGLFVIPARLREFGPADVLIFGLVPIAAAVGFRLIGPTPGPADSPGWTHRAGVWLLATWPVAWSCLVYAVAGLK